MSLGHDLLFSLDRSLASYSKPALINSCGERRISFGGKFKGFVCARSLAVPNRQLFSKGFPNSSTRLVIA